MPAPVVQPLMPQLAEDSVPPFWCTWMHRIWTLFHFVRPAHRCSRRGDGRSWHCCHQTNFASLKGFEACTRRRFESTKLYKRLRSLPTGLFTPQKLSARYKPQNGHYRRFQHVHTLQTVFGFGYNASDRQVKPQSAQTGAKSSAPPSSSHVRYV